MEGLILSGKLSDFETAEYFHKVSMEATLDEDIAKELYKIMNEIDKASKKSHFGVKYIFKSNISEINIEHIWVLLEHLNFKVKALSLGDITEAIDGLYISW